MILKILPDLDMLLTSLHMKKYNPMLNSLGDMAIFVYKEQISFYFGTPCI